MVKETSDSLNVLSYALNELGIDASLHNASTPDEGLIAENFFVHDDRQGSIVVRISQDIGERPYSFETEALGFLASRNAPTPQIIPFLDNSIEKHINGKRVMAYHFTEGRTLQAKEVSNPFYTAEASALLAKLITSAESYEPDGLKPQGDTEYIDRISKDIIKQYPDLADNHAISAGMDVVDSPELAMRLKNTPQGIVHADFFYQNVVVRDNHLVGIIDFGDAYYGAIVNDIVIGSIEFSILENTNKWMPEAMATFLSQHRQWLQRYDIDFELFHQLVIANCLRFAVYTLGFARAKDSNASPDDNPYIQNLENFRTVYYDSLRTVYSNGLQ